MPCNGAVLAANVPVAIMLPCPAPCDMHSAGSYENWRPDAADFPAADVGAPLAGWAGEKWLNIRSTAVRAIMLKVCAPGAKA